MTVELETGLPSVRFLQTWIREQQAVEVKLLTNEVLVGRVGWQDQHCICLVDAAGQQTLIWRQAIAYLKPRS